MDSLNTEELMVKRVRMKQCSVPINEVSLPALKEIMETLEDPTVFVIGVCGKDDNHMGVLLEKVTRRVKRDNLFGVIVTVNMSEKPILTRIQQDIADQLSFSFQGQDHVKTSCCVFTKGNDNSNVTENARQLCDRIRREPSILFILLDFQNKIDLAQVGIPVDHKDCKLILTSKLSNHMDTQRTFEI